MEHLPSIHVFLGFYPQHQNLKKRLDTRVLFTLTRLLGLTEDIDPALVHSDPQGTPSVLHGGHKGPGLRLHVVAFHAVQLVLSVVAPRCVDTVVQHTDP